MFILIMKLFKYFDIYVDIVWLVGGLIEYEGWLEVYYNEIWGIVCDDEINEKVFVVVCWILGLFWYDLLI